MRKQVIAVVTAILLGTATMTTGAMAFGRGGGFGHGGFGDGPRRLRRRIRTRFLRKRTGQYNISITHH